MALALHLHPEEVWTMDPADYATIVDELTPESNTIDLLAD